MEEQAQPGARRGLIAAAALCATAGALTFLVSRASVEVVVDLPADAPAPELVRLDEERRAPLDARFERLAPELSPFQESFVLTATGKKNPASQGTEIWIVEFPYLDAVVQDPPGSWERRENSLVNYQVQPAALRWSGSGAGKIALVRHDHSGIATVRTGGGERTVDLYSQTQQEPLLVPVEAGERLARYRALLPRGELRSLGLVTRDVPVRVFLGTWKPTVLISAEHAPAGERGMVVERWAPTFHDGAVRLGPTLRLEHGGSPTFLILLLVLALVAGVARVVLVTLRAAREARGR